MRRLFLRAPAVAVFLLGAAIGAVAQPLAETSIWKVEVVPDDLGKYKIKGTVFAIGDPVHETLTLKALIDVGIVKESATRQDPDVVQFIRGVFWNDDPCAQLFEESDFIPLKPSFGVVWYLDFRKAQDVQNRGKDFQNLVCPLLGRSHFGDLQFLHGMADHNGVKATETAERMLAWANVAYRIATGGIDARTPLEVDATAKRLLASVADQTPIRLMRAKTVAETRARILGSLLHMIQDSYAHGHATRVTSDGAHAPITQFLSYVDQDQGKHAHDDSWRDGNTDLERTLNIPGARDALSVSTQIVKLYKAKAAWTTVEQYLRGGPLLVTPDAQPSGPGPYNK